MHCVFYFNVSQGLERQGQVDCCVFKHHAEWAISGLVVQSCFQTHENRKSLAQINLQWKAETLSGVATWMAYPWAEEICCPRESMGFTVPVIWQPYTSARADCFKWNMHIKPGNGVRLQPPACLAAPRVSVNQQKLKQLVTLYWARPALGLGLGKGEWKAGRILFPYSFHPKHCCAETTAGKLSCFLHFCHAASQFRTNVTHLREE